MAQYKFFNAAMPTTAALSAGVTTGTAIKTLLQMKSVAAVTTKIIAWGISFDGAAAAAGIEAEILETGTVFGTVTAAAAADVFGIDYAGLTNTSTTYFSAGTTATGFTCTAEGSIVATRVFDSQLIQPTNNYFYQFPLGQEPTIQPANALRIRVKAQAAVNAICWVQVEV